MAVYKNKNNTWSVKGKIKLPNGKYKNYNRFKGNKALQSKKLAIEAERNLREQLNLIYCDCEDSSLISKTITFEELQELYFDEAKRYIKFRTIQTDKNMLNAQFTVLNDYYIEKITPLLIKKLIYKMDDNAYAISYINKAYTILNKLFKYALEKKYITSNPMQNIRRLKRPNEIKERKINFWTNLQFDNFIKNVDNYTHYVFFNFLYFTGCRKGEAVALRWKDISFEKKTFSINKTAHYHAGKLYLTPPKTTNSVRIRKIPSHLYVLMKDLYKHQKSEICVDADAFIFGITKPYTFPTLDRHFKHYKSLCNNPHMTLHGFRHSHVSYLINNGASAQDVGYRIGDTQNEVIKTYSHFFIEREDEAIKTLENHKIIPFKCRK